MSETPTSGRAHRDLAVLIVAGTDPAPLGRTLAALEDALPHVPVRVWGRGRPPAVVVDRVTRGLDIVWTSSADDLGRLVAVNRLMDQVPDSDALLLRPGVELRGPLSRARAALAEPGVAAVAPTASGGGLRARWDVAHRAPTVLRGIVGAAGAAEQWRGRSASDRYADPPALVDGWLASDCLLLTRDAWDALGPWDTRFFEYGADVVWQGRARAAGWTLRLVDEAGPTVTLPDDGAAEAEVVRRDAEVRRATEIMVLGGRNVGPGAALSAADLLLERVRPERRAEHRRRVTRARETAVTPEIVITSNGLDLGGAERQRVLLANELARRGHPVTVVALQKLGPLTAELSPRVRLLLRPWWQPVVGVAADEAVVIGGVTNTEIGFALGWRAQGLGRRRWLPATHDPARLDGPTYSAAQARALRRADGLVVLADAHHAELTRHQRLTDTVATAPNGIPLADARPYAPATAGGPVRFGMLTRLVEYKNPLLLIEALDALDRPGDWTLDIFGAGPDEEDLRARTPAHLADRVRWRGRSSGPDEAFEDIDVVCVPSGFEAFPLVMVEAMMRGIPVMASVSGAVGEMLDDGRAGVVVHPLTRERWTEATREVLDDPAGTAALGAAGRERALRHYTVEAMVDDYERAFARILGRPAAGSPADHAPTHRP